MLRLCLKKTPVKWSCLGLQGLRSEHDYKIMFCSIDSSRRLMSMLNKMSSVVIYWPFYIFWTLDIYIISKLNYIYMFITEKHKTWVHRKKTHFDWLLKRYSGKFLHSQTNKCKILTSVVQTEASGSAESVAWFWLTEQGEKIQKLKLSIWCVHVGYEVNFCFNILFFRACLLWHKLKRINSSD